MWHRKEGNFWRVKPAYCYPGTEVFVKRTGNVHRVVVRNVANEPMSDVEVSRQPKEAWSKESWRTITSAKDNARGAMLNKGWLETAGITFKPDTTQRDIHEAYRNLTN